MERIAAELGNMTVEELRGVRRVCASLARSIDWLLEKAEHDRAQAGTQESVAG